VAVANSSNEGSASLWASAITKIPQFTYCRRSFGCRHFHAKRGCRLADGVPQRRTDVCSPDADCIRPAVLYFGSPGRGHRRHRRSSQTDTVYRNLDGRRRGCACCDDHCRQDFARAVLPELVRKEDLPAASALNGIEFNFARAVGPALAGFVYRVSRHRHGVPLDPPVLLRGHSRRRTLEAAHRQTNHAA